MSYYVSKYVAEDVLSEGVIYPGEVYDANVSTATKPRVQLKRYGYPGTTNASITAWKTSAQVCTDGTGFVRGEWSSTHQTITSMGSKINAKIHPYIVLPEDNKNDVMLGDLGVVVDTKTNKYAYVIFAERGPSGKIGEMSVATFKKLGLGYNTAIDAGKPNAVTNGYYGYDELRFITLMFPGSGAQFGYAYDKVPKDAAEIDQNGSIILQKIFYNKEKIDGQRP